MVLSKVKHAGEHNKRLILSGSISVLHFTLRKVAWLVRNETVRSSNNGGSDNGDSTVHAVEAV